MRYILLSFFLLTGYTCIWSQNDHPTVKNDHRVKWYLLFMGADFGGLNSSLETSLQPESAFILGSNHKGAVGFSLFEVQPVLFNKFGFTIGLFEFRQANIDKGLVRSDFQKYLPEYTVSFPADDYEGGEVPISGGFNSIHSKVGLFGNFQFKSFAINPFCNYLFTYGDQTYIVNPVLTDPLMNSTFRRNYSVKEEFESGINPGVDLRYLHESGFVLGLRTQFNFLFGNGTVSVKDISESGVESPEVISEFKHDFMSYSIGLYVGFEIGANRNSDSH